MNLTHRFKSTILAISLLGMTACQSVTAQVSPPPNAVLPRTLTVTATGDINIPTTLTRVTLGVEVQGKTADEVQAEVARRSQAVVDFLKAQNVEKLQTTGVRLSPNYDYSNNRQTLTGYIGSNIVSFQVETSRVGNIIDRAVQAGATRIEGVNFIASEAAISDAQEDAIQEAVQKARQQADAALNALNFQAKEVVGISINQANFPQPVPYPLVERASLANDAAKVVTPIEGGEQTVEASVTLQIRY